MQLTGFSARFFMLISLVALMTFMVWMLRTPVEPINSALESETIPASSAGAKDKTAAIPDSKVPVQFRDIGIKEHLGAQVSIHELVFQDESGKTVFLKDFFKTGRPVLLTPVYYECPNLCNYMLNGFVKSLKNVDWTPGQQFEIVTFSINPKENAKLAQAKKAAYIKAYGRPEAASGWHFLTGEEEQIRKLTQEVGFGYKYNAEDKQYGHSAALITLTPHGKISRYLYGIEFKNKDLRLALLEASNGKIGNVIDRILLYCFQYDPQTRKYSLYSVRLMEAGCLLTVVAFGGYLALFWRRQRKGA